MRWKFCSPQRAHHYELVLLLADNLKLERCNMLNPATLLPLPTDGEKDTHDCTQILTFTSKSRDDITDQPLDNPEMSLFTDGSSYYAKERWVVGFAVTTETTVLIAGPLPLSLGAQRAEIVALTETARYAKGKKVNIYTDSKYAFRLCHATGALWKETGFLTSAGKTIAYGKQIKDLLEAIQLLTALAVIYIKAHTEKQDAVSRGNHLADQAARAAARHCNLLMAALQTKE